MQSGFPRFLKISSLYNPCTRRIIVQCLVENCNICYFSSNFLSVEVKKSYTLTMHTFNFEALLLLCISFKPKTLYNLQFIVLEPVLRIHLILMWILDPHWKKMDPDPNPDTKQNLKKICLIFFAYFNAKT